jgi:carbon-monoxide dehydrogenase medium subunit
MADPALAGFGATQVRAVLAHISRTRNQSELPGTESSLSVLNCRLTEPEWQMSVGERPADLAYVWTTGSEVRIGSLTTRAQLLSSRAIAERAAGLRDAVLAEPCHGPGIPGTIGAALCSPGAGDGIVAALAALRADVVIRSRYGTRLVPIRDFRWQLSELVVGSGDLVAEIRIRVRRG